MRDLIEAAKQRVAERKRLRREAADRAELLPADYRERLAYQLTERNSWDGS